MVHNKTKFYFKSSFQLSKTSQYFQCHVCNSHYHLLCRSPQNAQSQVSPNFYLKNWLCLTCANSIFPFHSLANNELSDLFNEGFLSKISSVELNNQFSNQSNNSLNFNNTDKNDTLLDISLNDTYFTTQEVNQSFNKIENKTFFYHVLKHTIISKFP